MRKFLGVIIFLAGLFGSASYVLAQDSSLPFQSTERVTLEADETINHDFFAAGEQVEIKGTVNGDLYAAGGNIVVEGTVNGDVLAAGGQIEISGTVGGNIRVAGGNIEVSGDIAKNLTAGTGSLEISDDATVGGSVVLGAGNVEIDGPVGGNIVAGAGNLEIRNTVGGNIYAGVRQLHIDENEGVAGDVIYWSEEEALVDQEATVSGTLERREPVKRLQSPREDDVRSLWAGFRLFSLLSMVAIGLLLLRFFPGILETGADILERKSWQSLGLGFLKLILEPMIAVIFLVTVIGIPLGIFLIFAYIAELYFASYFVVYWLGTFLMARFNQKANIYWTFIVGAVVFALVTSIPIVSGFVRFFSLLFGLGAILLLIYSWYQKFFLKKS